jgi:hypothetical protein
VNYRGSYRKLLGNAKAALLAAIEIYNKPQIAYRDECFVLLMLNAWELTLKALLSKNRTSIFYRKHRGQPYRTLSWADSLNKAASFFPPHVPHGAVKKNLDLLATYRDNVVHFYNEPGFSTLIYALAQTSIINLRDLLVACFQVDLGKDITWQLLPLGLNAPIDPIDYLSGTGRSRRHSSAVAQFLLELKEAVAEVKSAGLDTGRLLTAFKVKLESTKKLQEADISIGVKKAASEEDGPLAVIRTVDPNKSHRLRQRNITELIPNLHGARFTSFTFQAIVWKFGIRDKSEFCWKADEGYLTKYSEELVPWIKALTKAQVDDAVVAYKAFQQSRASGGGR